MVYAFDPIPAPPPSSLRKEGSCEESAGENPSANGPKPSNSDQTDEAAERGISVNGDKDNEHIDTCSKTNSESKKSSSEKAGLKPLTTEEEKRIIGMNAPFLWLVCYLNKRGHRLESLWKRLNCHSFAESS